MPNIIYAGSNSFSPGGTITILEDTTLSGGGTNVAFAVGAFTGTNGLAPLTYTSLAEWRQLAATFVTKTDEISANAITVDLFCSEAVVIGSSSADSITLHASSRVEVHAGAGDDTINTPFVGYYVSSLLDGGAGNDTITAGAGSDDIQGGSGRDILNGAFGNDLINGGTGADTMSGGLGDDFFIVDVKGDVVTEAAGEGTDTVLSSVNYQLGANVEDLILSGIDTALVGRGNALANDMIGNIYDNTLYGGDGDDFIYGREGADTLYGQGGIDSLFGEEGTDLLDGGLGNDWMGGGTEDDIYYVRDAGDIVVEQAGEGNDLVRTTIDYTLADNVEGLTLIGGAVAGTGNALDNNINGNDANNTLSGLAGRDEIYGRNGRDTLNGGSGADILVGGQGFDTLTGGADADRFVFAEGDLSRNVAFADTITDFDVAGGDVINLSRIDANTGLGADQAFTFLGTAAFAGVAGQLRFEVSGGDTWVQMDTTGDGVADYQIRLNGSHALTAGDFVL